MHKRANLSLANVGVNKTSKPPLATNPKHVQAQYPVWLRRQWRDFVCDKMRKLQLTQCALAEAANIDASYVWLVRRGWIPVRKKVAQIGRALGDMDGALRAAGMLALPDQPDEGFALSKGSLELLQLLSLLPAKEQDKVIKLVLPAVRSSVAPGEQAQAC